MSLTRGITYGSAEQLTNTKLHNLIDLATITIESADLGANFLASMVSIAGLLPTTNLLPSLGSGADIRYNGGFGFFGQSPNIIYAEIYCVGASGSLTLTDQNTWYQVVNFDTDGQAEGATPDHTNDHITIITAGVYRINCAVSFSGTGNHDYELQVQKNNGATALTNISMSRALGTGGDIGAACISGLASLDVNDTIELWARSTSGAGNAVVIEDCNLSIQLIKPT